MLINLDELPMTAGELRWFLHNRFGVFSFFDRDDGAGESRALRPWVEEQLAAADVDQCILRGEDRTDQRGASGTGANKS